MKLTIESTAIITTIDGVPVRLWRGQTEDGYPCEVFVHQIGASDKGAQAALEAALLELPLPREMALAEVLLRRKANS